MRRLASRIDFPRVRRFATAAVAVVLVQAVIVVGLIAADVNPQVALAIGIAVSMTAHFTLNRQWVFTDRGEGFYFHLNRQGVSYLILAGFNYVASALALALVPDALGLTPTAVYVCTTLLLGANNYLWLGQFVFKRADSVKGP